MENKKDYFGPIFLIFIGTIFLLNTTGILNWNIWLYILNFWPILLILGGIKLILGDSKIARIIMLVITFLMFIGIGIFSYLRSNYPDENFNIEGINLIIRNYEEYK